jgi:uncharacterized protein YecE (DUF72 family)
MEFGKVKDAASLDFTLPPDDPATAGVLANGRGGSGMRVHVGCPVWQDDALARKLCPKGTPRSRRLACYARRFNAIELNGTGYGLDKERMRKWAGETPPGFLFNPKIPREVTHVPNLDGVRELFASHSEAAAALGDRLGLLFLQFHDSFGPSRYGELDRFLAAREGNLPLALEVRHPAWFRNAAWRERLFGMLQERGIAAIITDTPGNREVLHQRLTTSAAFIRFNGAGGGHDFGRLESWAKRIDRWREQGLRDLYFFTHTDPVEETADLAAHFIKCLNRVCGLDIPEPRFQADEEEEPRLAL